MLTTETIPLVTSFSREAIERQLQKIILDPVFVDSHVLKNFLVFIVDETLKGNTNQLKEYTIAINVLGKPASFRPQDSGIVLIHAGRLRRALNNYYGNIGILDSIRISIPIGSYVPMFAENTEEVEVRVKSSVKSSVIAVAPFSDTSRNAFRISFADGLGVQLSNALMRVEHFSVVSYYTMRNQFAKTADIKHVAAAAGARFMVTGNIQMLKGNLRIYLQLIRVRSGQLVWNQMYERKFSPDTLFVVQDDIVNQSVSELASLIL